MTTTTVPEIIKKLRAPTHTRATGLAAARFLEESLIDKGHAIWRNAGRTQNTDREYIQTLQQDKLDLQTRVTELENDNR